MELAKVDLAAAGFEDASRRLQFFDGNCLTSYSGTWVWKIPCASNGLDSCSDMSSSNSVNSALTYIDTMYVGYYDSSSSPGTGGGYTGLRHLVFLLHGNYGNCDSMWNKYCEPNGYACPLLEDLAFAHLIFIFPSSLMVDFTVTPWAFSWSNNVMDPTTYSVQEDVFAAIMCDSTGDLSTTWGASPPACSNGIFHASGCNAPYDCPQLYSGAVTTASKVMIIGFSNGGGMGMYMQWKYSDFVTKVSAIDYWAYADYNTWLPAGIPPAPALDAHIWTNCATGYWDYGSYNDPTVTVADGLAIMTPPNTYWGLAGYSVATPGGVTAGVTYDYPTGPCGPASAGGASIVADNGAWIGSGTCPTSSYDYTDFKWEGSNPYTDVFLVSVHGFDSNGDCTAYQTSPSVDHAKTQYYACVACDIMDWVTPPPPTPPAPPPSVPPPVCWVSHSKFSYYWLGAGPNPPFVFPAFGQGPGANYGDMHRFARTFGVDMFYDDVRWDCNQDGFFDEAEAWNFIKYGFAMLGSTACRYYKCGHFWPPGSQGMEAWVQAEEDHYGGGKDGRRLADEDPIGRSLSRGDDRNEARKCADSGECSKSNANQILSETQKLKRMKVEDVVVFETESRKKFTNKPTNVQMEGIGAQLKKVDVAVAKYQEYPGPKCKKGCEVKATGKTNLGVANPCTKKGGCTYKASKLAWQRTKDKLKE
jgi:hypothetical protein